MRLLFATLFLLLFGGCGDDMRTSSPPTTVPYPDLHTNIYDRDLSDPGYFYTVDGDTIKVKFEGKITTIRLIGIDTFETHKNNKAYRQAYEYNLTIDEVIERGKRAKAYTRQLLAAHPNYYFEYDEDLKDRYGRTLGYLWFSKDEMLNLDIVCNGYAIPLTIAPDTKYAEQFKTCYKAARSAKIGIWNTQ